MRIDKIQIMKHIEVVAAIIVNEDSILCVQRGMSKYDYINKKYEFPGGKVESNETNAEAIVREVNEELKMTISVNRYFTKVDHSYPDFDITMTCFICDVKTKELTLSEHIAYQWLKLEDLKNLDWAAADIPVVEQLILRGL